MTDCTYYQELISRLVDGQLNSAEKTGLRDHVQTCEECAAMLDVFSQLSEIISEDQQDVPREVHENIMSTVRRIDMVKRNKRRRNKRIKGFVAAAACFAVVLFSAAGVISTFSSRRSENVVAADSFAGEFNASAVESAASDEKSTRTRVQASYGDKPTPTPTAAPRASSQQSQPRSVTPPEEDIFAGDGSNIHKETEGGVMGFFSSLFSPKSREPEFEIVPTPRSAGTDAPVVTYEGGLLTESAPLPADEPVVEPAEEAAPTQDSFPEPEDGQEASAVLSPTPKEMSGEEPLPEEKTEEVPEEITAEEEVIPEEEVPPEQEAEAPEAAETTEEIAAEEPVPSPAPSPAVTNVIKLEIKEKNFFSLLTDVLTGKKPVASPAPSDAPAFEATPTPAPEPMPESTSEPSPSPSPESKDGKGKLLPEGEADTRYEISLSVKGKKHTVTVECYGEKLYCTVPEGLRGAGTWKASCSLKDFSTFMEKYLPKVSPSPAPTAAPEITE